MNVIVPSSWIGAAIDASPHLHAIVVGDEGGDALADPGHATTTGGPATVPPHTPPARAMISNQHTWAELEPICAQLPSIELIQTLSQGVEFLKGTPERYRVSNAKGAHGGPTAELAITLLLALWRHIPDFVHAQDSGRWLPGGHGRTLRGARLLVLGAGDIAHEFQARAAGFGATCLMTGRTARDGIRALADLPALLPRADAVIATLPLNSATRGLVDAAFLARMKDGATLINVARGAIVDQAALLAELTAGRLTAGLDVTDPEPLPAGHPLWNAPGLLISPHAGGATHGVGERALEVAVAQLEQFAAGRLPDNLVKPADLR
jgi:phosphoglycerate dehydrogenase-like enzyme